MSSAAYARIHLMLAFLGLYVAGMLSMSHILGLQLPCGIGSGCDIVTQDPRSKLLGIPFAYYGLAGYGIIAIVAVMRLFSPPARESVLNAIGYRLGGLGLAVSIGLTIFSVTSIRAVCTWCIASAVTMSLLFAFYAFASMKPAQAQARELHPIDAFLFMFGLFVLFFALVASGAQFQTNANTTYVNRAALQALTNEELAPAAAHRTGPAAAKFTVVIFGDLTCGACEHAYGELTQLMQKRHDFQLVFRHLPLEFHPLARPAANLSELAADKGKFWNFTSQMYGGEGGSVDNLVAMANALGGK